MSDLAVLLLRHGYRAFEVGGLREPGRHAVVGRMTGRRAVVVSGEEGVRTFYDESVVKRSGAIPPPLAWLLFGRGAVHGLDGGEHRARKMHFLTHLSPRDVVACGERVGELLAAELASWPSGGRPVHEALVDAYGPAVLEWAGVELSPDEARELSREYATIVDGFGFAGAAYLRGWRARRRTDAWARHLVQDVRAGRVSPRSGSYLEAVAALEVPDRVAAIELGNVVRPTIAVSWLGSFAAAALVDAPELQDRMAGPDGDALIHSFCQEVRRTAPFVPTLAGLVHRATTVDGVELREGDHIVLDVRGVNHDPELHPDPLRFDPERFLDKEPGEFTFVPQGGGPPTGHRCPGEDMTLQLLVATVRALVHQRPTPLSPRRVDLARIPTLPEAGLVLQ